MEQNKIRTLEEIERVLEDDIVKVEENLRIQLPGIDLALAKDINGRYILLDAYVALAQIKILLKRE